MENKGRLDGLVTVKDCLRYQFKVEAQERGDLPTIAENARRIDRLEAWTWHILVRTSSWLGNRLGRFTGGRIKLTGGSLRGSSGRLQDRNRTSPTDGVHDYESPGTGLAGTATELQSNERYA